MTAVQKVVRGWKARLRLVGSGAAAFVRQSEQSWWMARLRPVDSGAAAIVRQGEQSWWAVRDSNPRLPACKAGALTN